MQWGQFAVNFWSTSILKLMKTHPCRAWKYPGSIYNILLPVVGWRKLTKTTPKRWLSWCLLAFLIHNLRWPQPVDRKEEKYKHQETKGKMEKYLKDPELGELIAELPQVSNHNGTSCFNDKKPRVRQRKKVITSSVTSSRDCGYDYKDEITPIIG